MIEQAMHQLLEPRLGQHAFGAPPLQLLQPHARPSLPGAMEADGRLLQPQRIDPMDSARCDQCLPDPVDRFGGAEINEGSGQRGARRPVAMKAVGTLKAGDLMRHGIGRHEQVDTSRPDDCNLGCSGLEPASENSRVAAPLLTTAEAHAAFRIASRSSHVAG
jgi:hypothetical protein